MTIFIFLAIIKLLSPRKLFTSIIHYNWGVKGLYLNGKGDDNYDQRREKTPPSARTQTFYHLPKTHKETLQIRPIVLSGGGIFDCLV